MKRGISKLFSIVAVISFCAAISHSQISGSRLIPVAKGWAKNQINAVIFRKNSVTTFRNTQYVAFYDEDSRVVIAKRRLNSGDWQIQKTRFTGDTSDAHKSISLAVDGEGFLHLAWDHHNNPLNYSRSLKPESLDFSEKLTMTGQNETKVSYPEFYNSPNGNLLFFFRDGASGNGDLVLNSYDAKTQKWSRLQNNLISGERKRSAYPQIAVDVKGTIHVSWVWRENPDVGSNHDLCYAKSIDGGKTWRKSSGETYSLPISAETAEYVWRIPQNSELINQTSMTADKDGHPFIATYWRPAETKIPQYQLVYFDGKSWKLSQISQRKTAFSLSGGGTKRIPISRPQIVAAANRVLVIFRDAERNNRVSLAVCDNLKKGIWQTKDLAAIDVGMWEPTLDQNLWNQKKILNLFVQMVGQGDGEKLENILPQMISILEWKP